jgi:hypothetical protein
MFWSEIIVVEIKPDFYLNPDLSFNFQANREKFSRMRQELLEHLTGMGFSLSRTHSLNVDRLERGEQVWAVVSDEHSGNTLSHLAAASGDVVVDEQLAQVLMAQYNELYVFSKRKLNTFPHTYGFQPGVSEFIVELYNQLSSGLLTNNKAKYFLAHQHMLRFDPHTWEQKEEFEPDGLSLVFPLLINPKVKASN